MSIKDADLIPRKSLKMIKLKNEDQETMNGLEEDYHAGASLSIPFMWESQPGTPKVKFHHHKPSSLLSPLTPPPSYFSPKPLTKSSSSPKTNFLNTIFRKRSLVKADIPSSPALSTSSSSSSSSSSSPSDATKERSPRARVRRLSFDSRVDEYEEEDNDDKINIESPVSTLRFRCTGDNEGPRSCYPKLIKVFMRDSK